MIKVCNERKRRIALGIVLLPLGVYLFYGPIGPLQTFPFGLLRLFGPLLFACGCVLLLSRRTLPRPTTSVRPAMLTIGLLMLLIGGFPWVYTPHLICGNPGNQGAGMLGTLLFVAIGLPGAVVTFCALPLRRKNPEIHH